MDATHFIDLLFLMNGRKYVPQTESGEKAHGDFLGTIIPRTAQTRVNVPGYFKVHIIYVRE